MSKDDIVKVIRGEKMSGVYTKGVVVLSNGSVITPIKSTGDIVRGVGSNFITFKNEHGDVVEMDIRDGSYRVVWTREELDKD